MAIRKREGRKSPWQVYWNNPITGKREAANFTDENEARKHDSLIRHRLRFDRESFMPQKEAENQEITLEEAYILYLREKQFDRNGLAWQLGAMKRILKEYGQYPINQITRKNFLAAMESLQANKALRPATVRNRLSVFRTVLRWCAENGLCPPIAIPKLPAAEYEKLVPLAPAPICPNHMPKRKRDYGN